MILIGSIMITYYVLRINSDLFGMLDFQGNSLIKLWLNTEIIIQFTCKIQFFRYAKYKMILMTLVSFLKLI